LLFNLGTVQETGLHHLWRSFFIQPSYYSYICILAWCISRHNAPSNPYQGRNGSIN
jgi:hypothetical protein